MASTPVVPAAPAAAPAPAAPASAAPTPAPSTPAVASPGAAPAAGAPPSTPQGPQPPAKLDASKFSNAVESYQAEVTWKQELEAFRAENPNVEITDESPWPTEKPAEATEAAPEAKPAEEAAKPAEGGAKPAEPEAGSEDYSLDEPAAPLTPQALNDLLKGDAALKAAIEANPAAKGALFKMAREHAELSQFKGIFAGKQAAEFARDTAN